jgi:predicted phage tail component-like protein
MILSYGGVTPPSFFRVQKVTFPALPPSNIKTLDIPARDGTYYAGKTYGPLTITVDFFIETPSPDNVMYYAEQLAEWLDQDGPAPLIFTDKPDRTYYAIVKDNIDIEQAVEIGSGSIQFFCPDPCSYGEEKTVNITPNEATSLVNGGTAKAFPKFYVTFNKSSSFLSVASPDGIVLLGNPSTPDKETIPKTENILIDHMSDTSAWVSGGSIENDVVQGSFSSDGYKFAVYNWGDPVSKQWYGPVLRRDLSQELQDFYVELQFRLSCGRANEIGKIELYLYDINGVCLGKLTFQDCTSAFEHAEPILRAGSPEGRILVQTHDKVPKPKIVYQRINGKLVKKSVLPTNLGIYNDFYGFFYISRKGNYWEAQIGRFDSNGKRNTRMTGKYTDSRGVLPQNKLAYVVIHMAKFDVNPTPSNAFFIEELIVQKLNNGGTIYNEDIFQPGDTVSIDMSDCSVVVNGNPTFEHLDPASDFFGIDGGTETEVLVQSEDDTATITAAYQERWL